MTIYPLIKKARTGVPVTIHPETTSLTELVIPEFKKVAVALDFRRHNEKILAFAIGQVKAHGELVLIHVLESPSSELLGEVTDDFEARKDEEQLNFYVNQLINRGYKVVGKLGYRKRSEEIIRIVREEKADILVMGAHGHAGVKDWIYGATINHVRHELRIPVLVVNAD